MYAKNFSVPKSKPQKMYATPSASSQNLAANSRDRSGSAAVSGDGSLLAELPWGAVKVIGPSIVDPSVQPGEYAAKTLFVDFVMTSERKIQAVLQESLVSENEAKAVCKTGLPKAGRLEAFAECRTPTCRM